MEKITVNCGDWGQSWGLGTQTIGKLSTTDNETFTWKGHCQGRHGNKWNRGSEFVFKFEGDQIVEVSLKGSRPNREAILQVETTSYGRLSQIRPLEYGIQGYSVCMHYMMMRVRA